MKIDLDNYSEIERDNSFNYSSSRRQKSKKKHYFLKFLLSLFLSIIIIGIIGYITLKFVVGPIITTVDGLPDNFPTEIAVYKLNEADINLQNPESREKVINGLRSMPDWMLVLFLNLLSDNLKYKLVENFGEDINVPIDFNAKDLKLALKNVNLENSKTVNLSWDRLDKTKEEIAAYYKKKLTESNFEFKESLDDYEINLGFWKDGIFGTMNFKDNNKNSKEAGYNSDVNISVNYLDEFINNEN